MFLLDGIFTWPITGLHWVVKELQQAAREERTAEAEAIRAELREMYLQLESGAITEELFDEKEGPLLDRLESVEETMRAETIGSDDDDEDDDEEDDDDDNDEDDDDDAEDDDAEDDDAEDDDNEDDVDEKDDEYPGEEEPDSTQDQN